MTKDVHGICFYNLKGHNNWIKYSAISDCSLNIDHISLTQGMPVILLNGLGDIVRDILSHQSRGSVEVLDVGAPLNSP